MADLIERDAALARIDCCLGNSLGGRKEFDSGLMQARKFVISTPAVNRWISVEDSLPEQSGVYLAYFTFKDGTHAIDIAYINTGCHLGSITHWMPLPEIPELEKE